MIKGLDISSYNDNYKREAEGCDFVIVKAGEGKRATNSRYREQLGWVRAQGFAAGTYYWLRPGDPKGQARWYVEQADPRADEFLVVDWERQNPDLEDRDPTRAEVKDFIDEVRRLRPNHKVGEYENKDFWETRADRKLYADFLWLAWYGKSYSTVKDYPGWTIWQHSEGPDYNLAKFDSRAAMKAWARGDNAPTPAPVVEYKRPALKERVSWRGGKTCTCVIESIEKYVEPRLKAAGVIKYSVDFFQLGYRGDVEASAGTHDRGGVVDVDQDSPTAIRIWREGGWAMWPRVPPAFMYHGHGVLNGCPHLPDVASDQLAEYRRGGDGLRGNTPDSGPRIDLPKWWDAIRDYLRATTPPPATGGGGGPAYDDDIEEYLMTAEWDRQSAHFPQKLGQVGKWQYLYITDKRNISFSDGPARIAGHLYVHIELKPGESAYFRVVEDEKDKDGKFSRRMTYEDHAEAIGTGGTTYWTRPLHYNAGAPSDGKVANYVRVQWHSSDPDAVIQVAGVHRYDGK